MPSRTANRSANPTVSPSGSGPQRAAVVMPNALAMLHSEDIEAACSKDTLPAAVVSVVRAIVKARACVVTEPDEADGPVGATHVYFRLGDQSHRFSDPDLTSSDTSAHAGPDRMVSMTVTPYQSRQWRHYQMAASLTARDQLRLALLREVLATSGVTRDPVSETITRAYPVMFGPIHWADLSGAITLWWWRHLGQGHTPEVARTMMALLMHRSVLSQLTFHGTDAPTLALPPD